MAVNKAKSKASNVKMRINIIVAGGEKYVHSAAINKTKRKNKKIPLKLYNF